MEQIEKLAEIAQEQQDKEVAQDPATRDIISIVHEFIQHERVMCYGGTAINNILPPKDRFYDKTKDVPDYDFFSETPQKHAKKLADIIFQNGYKDTEVKPGLHLGTFKVFSNFLGVADISFLDKPIFDQLWEESIVKDDIHYVPPNFLRMSMYLELSRPRGDVTRWKKIFTRLTLLNKYYPIKCSAPAELQTDLVKNKDDIENVLVKENAVLLGFNAIDYKKSRDWCFPIDVLVDPENYDKLIEELKTVVDGTSKSYRDFNKLLPEHTDIHKENHLIRVYKANACHSYYEVSRAGLKVASIPTLLQFFLATIYAPSHFKENIPQSQFICTSQQLIELANKSGKKYKLLTPINCVGHQESRIDMLKHKSELYAKLSGNKKSRQFFNNFFTYKPRNKSQRKK